MAAVISVINKKGGVGKSTITAGLATRLGAKGQKVLIIDTDSQGHASMLLGFDQRINSVDNNLAELLFKKVNKKKVDAKDFIYETAYENVYIIVGDNDLDSIKSVVADKVSSKNFVYESIINDVEEYFDFIIYDNNADLTNHALQVILSCDYILIPTDDEYMASSAVDATLDFYENIVEGSNTSLQVLGIIFNRVEPNSKDAKDMREYYNTERNGKYNGLVFDTEIEYSKVAKKLALRGLDANSNKTFVALNALAEEVLSRIG